jgi:YD repeat-containing protein
VNGDTVAYVYDDDGLLVAAGDLALTRDPDNGLLTETALDSVTTRTTYNAFGEPSADSAWVGTTLVFARTYTRDALGRIAEVVDVSDGVTTVWGYGYDAVGRLETVSVDSVAYAELRLRRERKPAVAYVELRRRDGRLRRAGPADQLRRGDVRVHGCGRTA